MSAELRGRAATLNLHGLLLHWSEVEGQDWVPWLIRVEEDERQRRSLERRIRSGKLGRFKSMADFDWSWPADIDREAIDELFGLTWVDEPANVVLFGPNGVGKSMIAKNLAYGALQRGYTVVFTTASAMLNDLADQDGTRAFERRIRRYCSPTVLVIDEVGYLSYDNRHADLLFEVVTRRYGNKPIVVTTNLAFGDWGTVFPNAACVVTLVDRLCHKAEVVDIKGDSYRLKEAKERAANKARRPKLKR